jgi:hypothetical protein
MSETGRTTADEVIDLAEIYVLDTPQPLPDWQRSLIRQAFSTSTDGTGE